MESKHALHRNTPKLAVVDPRGLAIASVAYYLKTSADVRPEPRVTRETFDVAGRSVAHWDPRLGSGSNPISSLTVVPDLSGQSLLTVSVDAGWRLVLQDEAGQVHQNWDGAGNTMCFGYDLMGRPSSIEQASANAALHCVERVYYGASEPDVIARNQCGRLIRHADTAGVREVADYSLQGEPISESRRFLAELDHPGWPEDEHQQNILLEQGAEKTYRTSWHYDASGEILEQVDAARHARRYSYTLQGQLQSTWLTVMGKSEQCLVSNIAYNAFGQIERETASNGVTSSRVYDPADGRLRQLLTVKGQRRLQDLRYDYDAVGNILEMTDESQPVTWFANQRIDPISRYGYDTLYRLINATGREVASAVNGPGLPDLISPVDPARLQNYSQSWCYDEGDNRLEQRHSDKPTHFMDIDKGSNRGLSHVEGQVPDFEASFDRNGNLKVLAPGQPLRWTARNQLEEVVLVQRSRAENDSERYVYDSAGMRVRKLRTSLAGGVTRLSQIRYLPGLEIRTEGADSNDEVLHVITTQTGLCSVRLLHWKEGRPSGIAKDQLRYSFDDLLGSSTLELDEEADLISYEGYYPYGGSAWWMGRSQVDVEYKFVRYSGKERDATGLHYYGYRYYASWLGRWINPDPAWAIDGLNFYRMVHNNPMSHGDKDGLYTGTGDVHERGVEISHKILGRGRGGQTVQTNALLDRGFEVAHGALNKTIEELESGTGMDSRLNEVYGPGEGVRLKSSLLTWFKTLRKDFISYKEGRKKDQFVFVEARKAGHERSAFISPRDEHRRIFVDLRSVADAGGVLMFAMTLIHEVSHHALGTHDFYYYRRDPFLKQNTNDFMRGLKFEAEVASEGRLNSSDEVVNNITDLFEKNKLSADELKSMFGASSLSAVSQGVRSNVHYRSQALFYNADSFALTAMLSGGASISASSQNVRKSVFEPEPDY